MLAELVAACLPEIRAFCRENSIQEFAVFGSAIRPDFTDRSNVDVLIRFKPSRHVGLFGLVRLQRRLSEILDGRDMDLLTAGALHPLIRERVLRERVVLHSEKSGFSSSLSPL